MMKKLCVVLAVSICLTAFAQAGSIDFSGRTWSTQDGVHRDDNSIPIAYVVNNADSVTITGVYGADASIVTALSLNVGDTVSYDYYLTKIDLDPVGDGITNWIGDATASFIDGTDNESSARVTNRTLFDNNHVWLSAEGTWTNVSDTDPTAPTTGIHFAWTFDSATSYSVTATGIATGLEIGTWNGTMSDIGDIQAFRLGLWDSEQDSTMENFTVVPEPVTIALLAFGSLAMRRRNRK